MPPYFNHQTLSSHIPQSLPSPDPQGSHSPIFTFTRALGHIPQLLPSLETHFHPLAALSLALPPKLQLIHLFGKGWAIWHTLNYIYSEGVWDLHHEPEGTWFIHKDSSLNMSKQAHQVTVHQKWQVTTALSLCPSGTYTLTNSREDAHRWPWYVRNASRVTHINSFLAREECFLMGQR